MYEGARRSSLLSSRLADGLGAVRELCEGKFSLHHIISD